ncbi:MAG: C-type lectin domain-containing protein [Polyangiaceae bacterium]|nr:C-type lectin domain-containing protein [Polyangiaceae bacterium]
MFSKSDVRSLVGWALVAPFAIGLGCIIPAETLPDPTGGSSTVGAGGVGGESGGGGTASSGTAGGSGGNTDTGICGDGMITPPEVCDPVGEDNTGWCSADCLCGTTNPDPNAVAHFEDGVGCFIVIKSVKKWDEAVEYCKSQNLHLASITSSNELSFIQSIEHVTNNSIWIGGGRQPGNNTVPGYGEWKWVNEKDPWTIFPCVINTAGCDNNINLWGYAEPNDSGDNEDCVGLLNSMDAGKNGRLNDFKCDNDFTFLCERALQ